MADKPQHWPQPVTLAGKSVTLIPLEISHAPALAACAGDLHELWYTSVPKPEDMETEVQQRLSEQAQGRMLASPFARPTVRPKEDQWA